MVEGLTYMSNTIAVARTSMVHKCFKNDPGLQVKDCLAHMLCCSLSTGTRLDLQGKIRGLNWDMFNGLNCKSRKLAYNISQHQGACCLNSYQ